MCLIRGDRNTRYCFEFHFGPFSHNLLHVSALKFISQNTFEVILLAFIICKRNSLEPIMIVISSLCPALLDDTDLAYEHSHLVND